MKLVEEDPPSIPRSENEPKNTKRKFYTNGVGLMQTSGCRSLPAVGCVVSRQRKEAMMCLRLHVVLTLLLVELTFLLGGGVLVLLVLRDEIVHVGLSLGELHLVHALAGVPVKEGLAAEHAGELLGHALPHLLDRCGVAKEAGGHLEALGGDVAHGGLDVVGDPLDEVGRVLVLDVEHLLVNLLGGHTATVHNGASEVAAVARIGGAHHVL